MLSCRRRGNGAGLLVKGPALCQEDLLARLDFAQGEQPAAIEQERIVEMRKALVHLVRVLAVVAPPRPSLPRAVCFPCLALELYRTLVTYHIRGHLWLHTRGLACE